MKHEMTPSETVEELKAIRDAFYEERGACPICIERAIEIIEDMNTITVEEEKQ